MYVNPPVEVFRVKLPALVEVVLMVALYVSEPLPLQVASAPLGAQVSVFPATTLCAGTVLIVIGVEHAATVTLIVKSLVLLLLQVGTDVTLKLSEPL